MYVRHNAVQWMDPPDFAFEPSPVWLDDDVMAQDPQSKTFLMNILSKSKTTIGPLRKESEAKRKEVEGARRVRQMIREGKDKRDEGEVVRIMFVHSESLHEVERRLVTAEVEMSTITSAMGDISIGMRNHAFKNQTFKIPTNCDLCADRIWGLSAKGLSCTDCGYTCHTKCELKVPADCPGELDKEARKAIKAERQASAQATAASPPSTSNGDGASMGGGRGSISSNRGGMPGLQRSDTMGSMNTLSSGYAASAHRSVSGTNVRSPTEDATPKPIPVPGRHRAIAPPPASFRSGEDGEGDSGEQRGKMLYPYQASGDGEITVSEGQEFTVLEADGGCTYDFSLINVHTDRHYRRLRLAQDPTLIRRSWSRPSFLHRASPSTITLLEPDTSAANLHGFRLDNLTLIYQCSRAQARSCRRAPPRWCQEAIAKARGGTLHVRTHRRW